MKLQELKELLTEDKVAFYERLFNKYFGMSRNEYEKLRELTEEETAKKRSKELNDQIDKLLKHW